MANQEIRTEDPQGRTIHHSRGLQFPRAFLIWTMAVLCSVAGAMIFVNRALAETIGFSVTTDAGQPTDPHSPISVTVADDTTLLPIGDATIRLSTVRGSLGDVQALTVSRPGYSTVTLFGVVSGQVTVYLKPLGLGSFGELKTSDSVIADGIMTDWAPFSSSSISGGVVVRSPSVFDLLHINVQSFLSPLRDKIDVFGSRQIPSNAVLPEQHVPFLFSSINLNKPLYRLPVPANRDVRLVGIEGSVTTNSLLSVALGGGLNLDFLNKLKFSRAGFTPVLNEGGSFHQDVEASLNLIPRHQVSVTPPPFKANVVVAALTDLNGDRQTLIPTDVKLGVNANRPRSVRTVTVAAPEGNVGTRDVLAVAFDDQFTRISGIIVDHAEPTIRTGDFLGTPNLTRTRGVPETIRLKAPSQGISAAVFEAADPSNNGQDLPVWYVYALPSAGEVSVKTDALLTQEPVKSFSQLQLEFGPDFDERAIDGTAIMHGLRRFTCSRSKQN